MISFVVMSYNFARYLPACVDSILTQAGAHEFEVIIVDDASTDDTRAYLATLRDPRIHVLQHERNLGHIATLTDGITAARGDIIARIDGDDRYRSCFLDETMRVFDAQPAVGCVYGDVAAIDEDGKVIEDPWLGTGTRAVHGGQDAKGDEFIRLLSMNLISAPTLIARRSAWLDVLPIPDGLAFTDWYVNLRIARRHLLYYRACTLAEYRMHPASLSRNLARDANFERSVLRILDQVFQEPDHAQEKRAVRAATYSLAYANLADRYAGWGMDADARRCWLAAIRRRPARLLDPASVGGLAKTLYRSLGKALKFLPEA